MFFSKHRIRGHSLVPQQKIADFTKTSVISFIAGGYEKRVEQIRILEIKISEIGELLRIKKWTLAVAESCTGGLIGHSITTVSGSSDYFLGGIIAYSNRIKVEQLNVDEESIAIHGAVSDVVACQMADGVRVSFGADIAISVTGIAGPNGGTAEKPVGTVFIGLATERGSFAERFIFTGDRGSIQQQTAEAALVLLAQQL